LSIGRLACSLNFLSIGRLACSLNFLSIGRLACSLNFLSIGRLACSTNLPFNSADEQELLDVEDARGAKEPRGDVNHHQHIPVQIEAAQNPCRSFGDAAERTDRQHALDLPQGQRETLLAAGAEQEVNLRIPDPPLPTVLHQGEQLIHPLLEALELDAHRLV
jgi:hypothetical protein